jgi:hypothetical protein
VNTYQVLQGLKRGLLDEVGRAEFGVEARAELEPGQQQQVSAVALEAVGVEARLGRHGLTCRERERRGGRR